MNTDKLEIQEKNPTQYLSLFIERKDGRQWETRAASAAEIILIPRRQKAWMQYNWLSS